MKKLFVTVIMILGASNAFAADDGGLKILEKGTSGLNGLHAYECDVETNDPEVREALPLAKTILAKSQSDAKAIYINTNSAFFVNVAEDRSGVPTIRVNGNDAREGRGRYIVSGWVSKVDCALYK